MIPLIIYASYRFGAFWMPANAHCDFPYENTEFISDPL